MYSEIKFFLLITEIRNAARARFLSRQLASQNSVIGSGFPHSEIRGSKLLRSSPRLIAAQHVLHRLSAPRHPSNTLKSLDCSHYQCPHTRQNVVRTLASRSKSEGAHPR